MQELLDTLDRWQREGETIALATLVRVHGTAPRLPGARMLVTRSGKMAGSVSGGCVESDIVTRAAEVLDEGGAVVARYGIADDSELAVGLTCAEIEVLIEPWSTSTDGSASAAWRVVRDVLTRHAAGVLAVGLAPAALAGHALALDAADGSVVGGIAPGVDAVVLDSARGMVGSGAVSVLAVEHPEGDALVFLQAFAAPARLVISGGSHTAIVLAHMAKRIGMHVTVIDARSAYLSRERFPDADVLVHAPPRRALAELDLAGAFVVSLTHDLKLDVPALAAALRGDVAYVGAMGSLTTHARRCAALAAEGFDAAALARIRTPIGLDIGSANPEEIAVAILAEMLAVRSGRDARPLRAHGTVHDTSRARVVGGRLR